jgi:hypothetical protein
VERQKDDSNESREESEQSEKRKPGKPGKSLKEYIQISIDKIEEFMRLEESLPFGTPG